MNKQLKTILIVVASIVIGVGAIAYGAMTAPQPEGQSVSSQKATAPSPATKPTTTTKPSPAKNKKPDLDALLKTEYPTIESVIVAAHPKIASDYTINPGKLYGQGEWFGATLTYKGSDSMNRDTLRVLLQKKHGVWLLRTTPPEILLSANKYSDVPKTILQAINKAISLPGVDTAPAVTASE